MTNAEETFNVVWAVIKRLILVVIGLYVLFRYGPYVIRGFRTAVVCVVAATILAYVLLPAVDRLCRRRVRGIGRRTQRLMATIVVFLAFFGLLAGAVTLSVPPVQYEAREFVEKFGGYKESAAKLLENAASAYARSVPEQIQRQIERIDYSRVAAMATDYVRRVLGIVTSSIGFVVELVLIPVLAFYFVFDYKTLTREIYGLFPRNRRREAIKIGRSVGHVLQSYIFGQLILCAIAGVLTGLFLTVLSVPYVVVLAVFAGVTRAIPVIGPVISGVPIVLVGLLNFSGPAVPLALLVFVTVMHFAESKFIMPLLIGERLHLHPAVVIVALLVGAEFFGLAGMFLAAPAAAVLRELLRHYYINPRCAARAANGKVKPEAPFIETRSA